MVPVRDDSPRLISSKQTFTGTQENLASRDMVFFASLTNLVMEGCRFRAEAFHWLVPKFRFSRMRSTDKGLPPRIPQIARTDTDIRRPVQCLTQATLA